MPGGPWVCTESGSEAGSALGARLGWASMILLESSDQSTVCFGKAILSVIE